MKKNHINKFLPINFGEENVNLGQIGFFKADLNREAVRGLGDPYDMVLDLFGPFRSGQSAGAKQKEKRIAINDYRRFEGI